MVSLCFKSVFCITLIFFRMDCTLRELMMLIKDVNVDSRRRGTTFDFAIGKLFLKLFSLQLYIHFSYSRYALQSNEYKKCWDNYEWNARS